MRAALLWGLAGVLFLAEASGGSAASALGLQADGLLVIAVLAASGPRGGLVAAVVFGCMRAALLGAPVGIVALGYLLASMVAASWRPALRFSLWAWPPLMVLLCLFAYAPLALHRIWLGVAAETVGGQLAAIALGTGLLSVGPVGFVTASLSVLGASRKAAVL